MRGGYFWGGIAVFFWSTAATIGGALDGKATYFEIVLPMQIAAVGALSLFLIVDHRVLLNDLKRIYTAGNSISLAVLLVAFSAFITIYHSAFYFSLHNAPRIQANIINYLWPLFLFISASTIFNVSREKIGIYELSLVLLAFTGAFTIAWDPASGLDTLSLNIGLLIAFIAALSAPVYMNLSVIVTRLYFSRSYFVYLLGFFISVPILSIVFSLSKQTIPLEVDVVVPIVYLGVGCVALAHFAWTKAMTVGPSVTVANLAYLVPVLSTMLLIIFLGDEPSPKILFGATLIITSNVLSNAAFRRIYAESGALIAFFGVSFLIYFKTELGIGYAISTSIPYLGEIFAIISGFFLTRMWQKTKDEQLALIRFSSDLESYVRQLPKNVLVTHHKLIDHLDQLMIRLSDFDVCRSPVERALLSDGLKQSLSNFLDLSEEVLRADKTIDETKGVITSTELKRDFNAWLVQKFDRATSGEIAIISLLGVVGAVIVITTTEDNAFMEIVGLVFIACIAYIVLKIRDYNTSYTLSEYSRLVIVQSVLKHIGLTFYIPDVRLLYNRLRPKDLGGHVRYRSEEGQIVTAGDDIPTETLGEYRRSRNILLGLLIVGVSAILILLLEKRLEIFEF